MERNCAFDVFKKLKRKRSRKGDRLQDEEARLSKSLRRAPGDLRVEYERNQASQGEQFRQGDLKVHASLTATLLKLNNGLVAIITSFLGSGRNDVMLDYRSLTSLSESSRIEALSALSQLSYRLSQSSLSLLQPSQKHNGNKHARKKSHESEAATIRRIQASNASESQLAIVKPRPRRRTSGGSRPSGATHVESKSNPVRPTARKSAGLSSKSTPNLRHHVTPSYSPVPSRPHHTPKPEDSAEEIFRRRVEKVTPSMHTFASNSTKVGEIPMCKWNTPYDFDEMMRRNAEAASKPAAAHTTEQKPRGRLFNLFRKSSKNNI